MVSSGNPKGQIQKSAHGHYQRTDQRPNNSTQKSDLNKRELFEILQILYVNDGAFISNSREDKIEGLQLINSTFSWLGLEMTLEKEKLRLKQKWCTS